MRVAISGTGGTGKSTLANHLAAEVRVPLIDEAVRDWLREHGLTEPWSLPLEEQLQLQRHVISFKIAHERGLGAFISDRTTIDAVTLTTLRLERLGVPVPDDLREEALRHAHDAYDVAIILGPKRIAAGPDTVAMLDPTLRPREYDMTLNHYRSLGIPTLVISTEHPEEILPAAHAGLLREKTILREIRPLLREAADAAGLDASTAALYLWGSVVSDDFDPEASDIDALLITSAAPPESSIARLRNAASERHGVLSRLDLVVFAIDELSHDRRRAPFDRIDPDAFFARSREWQHVWGRTDLLLPFERSASLSRQLQVRLDGLRRRLRLHLTSPQDEPPAFILKELGFIAHLVHQLETGAHPFSYGALERHANGATREVVAELLRARTNRWTGIDAVAVQRLAERLVATFDATGVSHES